MRKWFSSRFHRLPRRGFRLVVFAALLAAVLIVGVSTLRTPVAHADTGCSNWYIDGSTQWSFPVYGTPHISSNVCSDGYVTWIGSWGPDCNVTGDGSITVTWCGAPYQYSNFMQLGVNWTETFTEFGVTFTCYGWYRFHTDTGGEEGGLNC